MSKNVSKRALQKQDMDKLNKTALMIGGVLAVVILVTIIISFF